MHPVPYSIEGNMVTENRPCPEFCACPMSFELPFISSYSLRYQLGILLVLLFLSYLHRGVRLTLAFLATLYIGFFSIVSVIRWIYYLFKAIAMLGFYMHFFLMGLRYIILGLEWAQNELDHLLGKLKEEQNREEELREEQEQESEGLGRRRKGRRSSRGGARRWGAYNVRILCVVLVGVDIDDAQPRALVIKKQLPPVLCQQNAITHLPTLPLNVPILVNPIELCDGKCCAVANFTSKCICT